MTDLETTRPAPPSQAIDAEAGNRGAPPQGGIRFANILDNVRRGDVGLALGIVCILVVLILPIPAWMLDVSLALSITFSVMILMTCLFIQKPLEFNSFPTVLLIATILRLSLNLASTRLILADGHEGPQAAGRVIEAFSSFVMSGNFVIGIIVFAILVIVNFVVITKGAVRIAEVAARFTLDAMPVKQMVIDADLSTGIIDETEATRRRRELEDESKFFGAMDGASKFVRGDAIAGILITFINIIGGIIVGVAQNDLSFGEATDTYSRLTVGAGLVSQIPALIVSTAAGLLVSKAGITGSTDKALFSQLTNYPRALALTAFLAACLSILPGMPMLPFLILAAIISFFAWIEFQKQGLQEAEEAREAAAESAPAPLEEPISKTLAIDDLRLELGYGLLPLISQEQDGFRLPVQIRALRRQIASDMGFVMPSVRILDNMQLAPHEYVVQVKEVIAGRGELRVDKLLAMDPRGEPIELAGEATREPTFDLPAMWIDPSLREEASFRGLTVVDPPTVITTYITEIIKSNMSENAVLRGDQEVAGRVARRPYETCRRTDPDADFSNRGSAHPATPAFRTYFDPGFTDHIGRRRGGGWLHPEYHPYQRACAVPPGSANLQFHRRRQRQYSACHFVTGVGGRICRVRCRSGRRSTTGNGTVETAGFYHPHA